MYTGVLHGYGYASNRQHVSVCIVNLHTFQAFFIVLFGHCIGCSLGQCFPSFICVRPNTKSTLISSQQQPKNEHIFLPRDFSHGPSNQVNKVYERIFSFHRWNSLYFFLYFLYQNPKMETIFFRLIKSCQVNEFIRKMFVQCENPINVKTSLEASIVP